MVARLSRQLPRHYTPGTSLKYANTQLSGRPFRFLGRPARTSLCARARVCMSRNVYDHGEIKSTAKILPLIRMWWLLLLLLPLPPPPPRRPLALSIGSLKPILSLLPRSSGTQD